LRTGQTTIRINPRRLPPFRLTTPDMLPGAWRLESCWSFDPDAEDRLATTAKAGPAIAVVVQANPKLVVPPRSPLTNRSDLTAQVTPGSGKDALAAANSAGSANHPSPAAPSPRQSPWNGIKEGESDRRWPDLSSGRPLDGPAPPAQDWGFFKGRDGAELWEACAGSVWPQIAGRWIDYAKIHKALPATNP